MEKDYYEGSKISKLRKSPNFGYIWTGISLITFITSIVLLSTVFNAGSTGFLILILVLTLSFPNIFIGLLIGSVVRSRRKKSLTINQMKSVYQPKFNGESEEELICMICKLEIFTGDIVYICPNCKSYYHESHFLNWLVIKATCPVCEFNFLQ